MAFFRSRVRRIFAKVYSAKPRICFLSHWTPQITIINVTGWKACKKVHISRSLYLQSFRPVCRSLIEFCCQNYISMGVLNINNTICANNTNFKSINSSRPNFWQRPTNIHTKNCAIFHSKNTECCIFGSELSHDFFC